MQLIRVKSARCALADCHLLARHVSGGLGLRNAGLTEYLSGVLNVLAETACGPRRSAPDSSLPSSLLYEQYADGTGWRVVH